MTRNAVLFDIDGVLVDVRPSYIDSIRKAVDLYLQKILLVPFYSGLRRPGPHGPASVPESRDSGLRRPGPQGPASVPESRDSGALLSREDVNRFKLLGGFNNDWDTVYGILLYLQSQVEQGPRKWEILTAKKLRALFNLKILRTVPRPCGIQPVKKLVKNPELISYALAKDIFQEIYLGEKLFKKDEGRAPLFSRVSGLIHFEKLLFPKALLGKLKAMGFSLGIVTGRTRFEAEYVLKRFGIRKFFKAMITHDDVAKAEQKLGEMLRKPHPFPVLACAKIIGRHRSFVYAGDLPDDIRAANASKKTIKILSCGVLYGQDEPQTAKQEFKKAGADFLIAKPADLLRAVSRE